MKGELDHGKTFGRCDLSDWPVNWYLLQIAWMRMNTAFREWN